MVGVELGDEGVRSKWHNVRPSWNSVVVAAAAIAASLNIVCVCVYACLCVYVCGVVQDYLFQTMPNP